MTIIIDGYNVLKPLAQSNEVGERRRARFIERVAAYARSSSNDITIVFDGGDSPFPERVREYGIVVYYSGYKESADDVIKRLLNQARHADVILVSTDRDLCWYAENLEIVTIDSHVFYGYMSEKEAFGKTSKLRKNGELHKREGHESEAEIDALMEEASSMMFLQSDDDEYTQHEHRRKQKKKCSKAERRLQKIVKKL